jgi:SAM-dependent methyltransferase
VIGRDADLRPVIEQVLDARGVDLAGMDGQRLANSVARRMDVVGAADHVAYVDVLRERPAEVALLFDALLADRSSLAWGCDVYPRIEERFLEALDVSLGPRGPDMLYEMVGNLGLPPRAAAADVGCGEGRHTVPLAERFGFDVVGIDIVQRHLDLGNQALAAAAERDPSLLGRVRFALGDVEALPVEDAALDLIWGSEWGEFAEERAGAVTRRLLHTAGCCGPGTGTWRSSARPRTTSCCPTASGTCTGCSASCSPTWCRNGWVQGPSPLAGEVGRPRPGGGSLRRVRRELTIGWSDPHPNPPPRGGRDCWTANMIRWTAATRRATGWRSPTSTSHCSTERTRPSGI